MNYRKKLIEMVKELGQEVIDRAEELVGDTELLSEFDIWLRFPSDGYSTLEVTKSYIGAL